MAQAISWDNNFTQSLVKKSIDAKGLQPEDKPVSVMNINKPKIKQTNSCGHKGCNVGGIHSHPDLKKPFKPDVQSRKKRIAPKKESLALAPMYSEQEIKKGDKLWSIAKTKLGAGASNQDIANYVKDIAKANKLKDPNVIRFGQKLKMPFTKSERAEVYQTQVENPRLDALKAREEAEKASREAIKKMNEENAAKYQIEVEEYQTQVENPRLDALKAREEAEKASREAIKKMNEENAAKYQIEVEEYQMDVEEPRLDGIKQMLIDRARVKLAPAHSKAKE